MLHWIEFA